MDLVTLLGSFGAVRKLLSSVSATLYKVIQDMKPVDKTVEALFREIASLQGSIDAIDSALRQPPTQAIIRDDEDCDLWRSVNGCLLECRRTVERLKKLMGDRENKPSLNPFRKAMKQNEVDWKSAEVVTLPQQIHSHSLAMQLALQAINVYVSSKAPETAVGSLSPKVNVLINMIAAVDLNWLPQGDDQTQQNAVTEKRSQAEENLRAFASRIASSVSTIVTTRSTPPAGNAQNPTRVDSVRGLPARPDNRSEGQKLTRRTSSIVSSAANQPRPENAVGRVRRSETISESTIAITPEVIKNLVKIAEKNLDQAEEHFNAYVAAKRKFREDESKIMKQGTNPDSSMPSKHYVNRGGQKWLLYRWEEKECQENLVKAEKGFVQALKEGGKTSHWSFNSDCNIEFSLARIYRRQKRWGEHDHILGSLLNSHPRISAGASADLASAFLYRNMLNEADEFCRRALKLWTGRVKEDDASYRWTMELAIKICKARGENELAEAYEAQLPATKPTSKTPREQLLSVFQSARKR